MSWNTKRKAPYTEAGIKRLRCIRCGGWPPVHQWQICSDGNYFRPLCQPCDNKLQRVVLRWMRHPQADLIADLYAERRG